MTPEIKTPLSPKTHLNGRGGPPEFSRARDLGDQSGYRIMLSEDQIVFRQWRRGFLIFYGAIVLLVCGFAAAIADRPTLVTNPAIASADTITRLRQ
jgi:hypothetical protein